MKLLLWVHSFIIHSTAQIHHPQKATMTHLKNIAEQDSSKAFTG